MAVTTSAAPVTAAPARTDVQARGPAGDVEVDVLNIQNGGVNIAKATHIDIRQGGISRAEAEDVAVQMGGIGLARADRITAERSGIGLAAVGEARIKQSFVRTMFARDVRIEQGAVWDLLANHVTFERQSFAGVVIARRVEGNVKTLVDWRGALAIAGVLGIVTAIIRRR